MYLLNISVVLQRTIGPYYIVLCCVVDSPSRARVRGLGGSEPIACVW